MRIAITTNTTGAGGAEKQRILLANALAERGHRVVLVVLQQQGALHDLLSPNVQVVRTSYGRALPVQSDVLLSGTTNTELTFGFLNRLRGKALRWLTSIHNPVSTHAPRLKRLSRSMVRLADARIALTPQHAIELSRIWGVRAEHVISNAVEGVGILGKPGTRQLTGRIGFLGRLSIEHKGLDRLLEGMASPRSSKIVLEIAGTGPDEARVRKLIRDRGLESRVLMSGFAIASDFFERVDGLVMLSRWEAQPMVLLEASLAGLPVVVSREVDSSSGVDADDAHEVAGALVALSEGHIPTKVSRSRSLDDMALDYLAAFEATLRRRRFRK